MTHGFDYDLLGLMPCPVKVPMERKISEFAQQMYETQRTKLRYQVYSNAVMQEDIFEKIDYIEDESELPGVMIAPGFGRFFRPAFTQRFRDTETFSSVFSEAPSKMFEEMGIIDKTGHYDIIAINPLVFLVDKTLNPDLPTPHRWSDLLDEVYEDKVAVRGHNETDICEAILFTMYRDGGREALEALGRSCCARLHPSEMVKMCGSHKAGSPAVSILPYSFAHLVRKNPAVEIVWPDDGAIVNPVVMVTKKQVSPAVRSLARFFVEPEGAQIFESVGFCSVCPDIKGITPEGARFNWIGWDFLAAHDVADLNEELNEIVGQVFHARKGLPPRAELIQARRDRRATRHADAPQKGNAS